MELNFDQSSPIRAEGLTISPDSECSPSPPQSYDGEIYVYDHTDSPPPSPIVHQKKHWSSICPRVVRATHLNSNATSSLVMFESDTLIVGKANGEVVFLPYSVTPSSCTRTPSLIRNCQQREIAVTALCYGLRSIRSRQEEVVAIAGNGYAQVIIPPANTGQPSHPRLVHIQMLHANICASFMHSVDKNRGQDLIVMMTDRVVRTYRWNDQARRFIPIGKWEVPSQISAVAIGDTPLKGTEAWLSQLRSHHYVSVRFTGVKQSVELSRFKIEDDSKKLMIMPYRCHFMCVITSTIREIIIVANLKERRLVNPGYDICAASTIRLPSFNVVVTIDRMGTTFIYAYNERKIKNLEVEPVIEFMSLASTVVMSMTHRDQNIIVAVVNDQKRVLVHAIPVLLIKEKLDASMK